jgi:hypothetical protein
VRAVMSLSKTCVMLAVLLLVSSVSGVGQAISGSFFNLTVANTDRNEPFPSTYVKGIRLWCTGTDWSLMNPSPGVYDFTKLDRWLQEVAQHNLDPLFTFARVPVWASSNPDLYCNSRVKRGECAPPDDLNADGTGPDQHWKNFVTAIVTHSVNSPIAHIKHWEIWNEPDTHGNWKGTMQQMVRMTADAAAIIKSLSPTSTINSPAPTGEYGINHGEDALTEWMRGFLAAGGGQYLDIVDFHSYVWKKGSIPTAEEVVPLIENVKPVLAQYGLSHLPMWATEGSYSGRTNGIEGITDPYQQAAFTARYLLLQRSEGLSRFFWFEWDSPPTNGVGTLWSAERVPGCTTPNNGGGYLCTPGVAYEQISNWMIGATFTNKCAQQSNSQLWSCTFSRARHYEAEAIWDPSKICKHGQCTVGNVEVPSQYTQYRDLDGQTHSIQNNTVPVGARPILLENHDPGAR